ncbi:INCE protein, partial [Lophotis ruficrista]|nr:INCE protein [Lophotis ruficrista]
EKERQRLESLRRKQEAEEQRRKKVEEETRRRQAEMRQKREERLKKALQARERVEQMEEEKKKRMERKILQNDEKVCLSQVREEKAAEERSKRKLLKKHEEADARKQKALRTVRATLGPSRTWERKGEDEFEQPEPLQTGREDEVKEKGKKVLDLKNLVEQQQGEQVKERYWFEEDGLQEPQQQLGEERKIKPPEALTATSGTWLSKAVKVSPGSSEPWDEMRLWCLAGPCGSGPAADSLSIGEGAGSQVLGCRLGFNRHLCERMRSPLGCLAESCGAKEPRPPKASENNYGMDLNSDDSTDDENEPRKPVPAWADGSQLNQAVVHQYYHPVNADQLFGLIPSPKLEDIFGKSKPRYFKRTSSAVWHSPP